jgi:hypothetical protein
MPDDRERVTRAEFVRRLVAEADETAAVRMPERAVPPSPQPKPMPTPKEAPEDDQPAA